MIGRRLIISFFRGPNFHYVGYRFPMEFGLIAQFVAAGTYEISRRLAAGEALEAAAVFGGVWSRAGRASALWAW